MSVYALTPLAKADIFDIWSYIDDNSNSGETANRVEEAIYDACAFVAEAPMRRHSRSDLTSRSLCFWTLTRYPNYTVVYWPETSPIKVVKRMSETKSQTTRFWRFAWKQSPWLPQRNMYACQQRTNSILSSIKRLQFRPTQRTTVTSWYQPTLTP
jgi:plasmid stabilization system protein ParE